MKKSFYLALAALSVALFACTSKPADSEQASEQQESVETLVEEPAAEEAPAVEAEEPAAEEAAAEEPAAEEPAAEPAAEEPDEEEPVFTIVESMAVPPCSGNELMELLTVDLNKVDPEANKCRVMVQVIIEKDGRLSTPVVKRSSNNEKLDAYAVQYLMEKCPRFKEPAKQNGHAVRTRYVLPVTFMK